MGKASNRKKDRITLTENEGALTVSFIFAGKLYKKTHQFTHSELEHMKTLCAEHGDAAANQVVWKMATRYGGYFAENVLAQAGSEYVAAHFKGPRAIPANVLASLDAGANGLTYADFVKHEDAVQQSEGDQDAN